MTLRILIYCDDHGNGGAAMATHRLALGLAGRGHDVRYAQMATESALPRIAERAAHGIAHVAIPYDTIRYFKPSIDDVRMPTRILVEQQPDVVLFSDALVESTLGAKAAAAFLSVPYLVVKHLVLADGLYAHDAEMGERVGRSLAAAAGIITVSNENGALLATRYPDAAPRLETIYNNVPDRFFAPRDPKVRQAFRQTHAISDDAVVVLTAAALVDRKGFHYQAALLERLRRAGDLDRFVFVWAGEEDDAYFTPIWGLIRACGCDGAVRRIGFQRDIVPCLDAADIMLLPSEQEALGLINIEAMAKGLPVLASGIGGIPEAVGDSGVLIPDPVQNAEAAIEAMRATLLAWSRAPEERNRLGRAGRDRARSLFATGVMVERYEAAIRRAVFPAGDYVSPVLPLHRGDWDMPFIAPAPPERLASEQQPSPHTRYVDIRFPRMPGLSLDRDACLILYAAGRQMAGHPALDAGYSFGWIPYHLLHAGMRVDTLDAYYLNVHLREAVTGALPAAFGPQTRIVIGSLTDTLAELVAATSVPWALAVIDVRRPGNGREAILACAGCMADDALLFVLGLEDEQVGEEGAAALKQLQQSGWRAGVFRVVDGLGLAWRGRAAPPPHVPDPLVFGE